MVGPSLRLFTDRAYLPEGWPLCMLLLPFWGGGFHHNGYDRFIRTGPDFLRLTPADEAEVAVLPFDGERLLPQPGASGPDPRAMDLATRFVERASAAGLKTIVIVNSDSARPIPLRDTLFFRTSLDRSRRGPNEFALPAWHEDLVATHLGGRIVLRERGAVPSIGFCGHAATAGPSLRRRIKMLVRRVGGPLGIRIEHNDGIHLRRTAMQALEASPRFRTQFIVRSQYFGGTSHNAAGFEQVRRDYIQNLLDNDFALSVRGYGNFSFRFFEAISIGRIPLLIDTDCVLPYDFLHDYRSLCLIVPEDRVRQVGTAVAEFYDRFSAEGYLDLQRRLRDFWVEWLSPEGFFRNLPLHWRPRPTAG